MDLFKKESKEGTKIYSNKSIQNDLKQLELIVGKKVTNKTIKNKTKVYCHLLVGICILIASFVSFQDKFELNSLNQYYEPIPIYASSITREINPTKKMTSLDKFYLSYSMNKFDDCLALFPTINKTSIKDSLYFSIALLLKNKPQKVLNILNLIAPKKKEIQEIVLWYKSLSHLKLHKYEMAKLSFKKIISLNGDFKEKSIEIIKSIP